MESRIIKDRGIERIIQKYIPATPEEADPPVVNNNNLIALVHDQWKAYLKFRRLLSRRERKDPSFWRKTDENYELVRTLHRRSINIVFTPREVNLALQALAPYVSSANSATRSNFINILIQNSYDAGHNHFVLNTELQQQHLYLFCSYLHGKPGNPLDVTIFGDVGMNFAAGSDYYRFEVNGNIGLHCNFPRKGRGELILKGNIEFPWSIEDGQIVVHPNLRQQTYTLTTLSETDHERFRLENYNVRLEPWDGKR